jgi:hypothetical protein
VGSSQVGLREVSCEDARWMESAHDLFKLKDLALAAFGFCCQMLVLNVACIHIFNPIAGDFLRSHQSFR